MRDERAMTPAERYVTLYPDRAAAVLDAGGLPTSLAFPPPDPALIVELLTSTSPVVHAFVRPRNRAPATGRSTRWLPDRLCDSLSKNETMRQS